MQGLSIACSTEHAIKWDESWANSHEISGRAMVNVHDAQQHLQPDGHHAPPMPEPVGNGVSEVRALSLGFCMRLCVCRDAVTLLEEAHSSARLADNATMLQVANGPARMTQPGREPDDGGLNNLSRVEGDGSLKPPDR